MILFRLAALGFLVCLFDVSCTGQESGHGPLMVQIEDQTYNDPLVANGSKPLDYARSSLQDYESASRQCDKYVSNDGRDSNSGSFEKPYLTPARAISKHRDGGVICLKGGTYSNIKIIDIVGSKTKPLVLKRDPLSSGKVLIRGSGLAMDVGVFVLRSNHVYILGLDVQKFQTGIIFYAVQEGGIIGNRVSKIGLAGIKVGQNFNYKTKKFEDYPSNNIAVLGNTVEGTGFENFRRLGKRHKYGEGIYIGTGAMYGDTTHNVLVKDNRIRDTSAEAIEVKAATYNVQVINNTISDVSLSFKGAITVSIGSGKTNTNGNYQIIGNNIRNVRTRGEAIGGIAVGHGNTLIEGNTISQVEGGVGIRLYQSFQNLRFRTVVIRKNLLQTGSKNGIVIRGGNHGHPGYDAIVELVGNTVNSP